MIYYIIIMSEVLSSVIDSITNASKKSDCVYSLDITNRNKIIYLLQKCKIDFLPIYELHAMDTTKIENLVVFVDKLQLLKLKIETYLLDNLNHVKKEFFQNKQMLKLDYNVYFVMVCEELNKIIEIYKQGVALHEEAKKFSEKHGIALPGKSSSNRSDTTRHEEEKKFSETHGIALPDKSSSNRSDTTRHDSRLSDNIKNILLDIITNYIMDEVIINLNNERQMILLFKNNIHITKTTSLLRSKIHKLMNKKSPPNRIIKSINITTGKIIISPTTDTDKTTEETIKISDICHTL